MASGVISLFEFLRKCAKYPRAQSIEDFCLHDIVACFAPGEQEPCVLGKVLHVGTTTLKEGHEDGEKGDVFVLSSQKTRAPRGKELNEVAGWWKFDDLVVLPIEEQVKFCVFCCPFANRIAFCIADCAGKAKEAESAASKLHGQQCAHTIRGISQKLDHRVV